LFASNSDVPEHGARQLGKEAFGEIEPGAMLRGEGKFEAALGLGNEPGFGFLRSVDGMVVEDDFDRGRSSGVFSTAALFSTAEPGPWCI
jgi:hypothetical protein